MENYLNEMTNINTQPVQGAMYAFPSINLSQKCIQKAEQAGMEPDTYYCMELLKNTGISVVPGWYFLFFVISIC